MACQQDSNAGAGDWDGIRPKELGEACLSWTSLGGADQEGEAASGGDEGGRNGERGLEALDGAESDYVEAIAGVSTLASQFSLDGPSVPEI